MLQTIAYKRRVNGANFDIIDSLRFLLYAFEVASLKILYKLSVCNTT